MKLVSIQEVEKRQIKKFSSGEENLDMFFHRFSLTNDTSGYGKTYVLVEKDLVIGFFTLCSAQIMFESFPTSGEYNIPKYPIPCIKIARLAVDKKYQHQGYGAKLLKEAFTKSAIAASSIGIKLLIVDAKENSKSFYEHYGFKKLLDDCSCYFLEMDTIFAAIKESLNI